MTLEIFEILCERKSQQPRALQAQKEKIRNCSKRRNFFRLFVSIISVKRKQQKMLITASFAAFALILLITSYEEMRNEDEEKNSTLNDYVDAFKMHSFIIISFSLRLFYCAILHLLKTHICVCDGKEK